MSVKVEGDPSANKTQGNTSGDVVLEETKKEKGVVEETAQNVLKASDDGGLDRETKISLLTRAGKFDVNPISSSRVEELAKGALELKMEDVHLPSHPAVKGLMDFLETSPTAWHAVNSARRLCVEQNGFTELKENEPWKIEPGGKYFVTRNGSSFISFVMPTEMPKSVCILGAHTDSPGLKLKPDPEKSVDNVTLLCPEVYGGPIISSWFDKSLGLAGRITYLDESSQKKSAVIDLGKTVGTISHVAIHLERTLGEEHKVNRQQHLPAVTWIHTGDGKAPSHFEEELKKIVPFTKLLSHELFFIPREAPEIVHDQQVYSAKLDNLLGTHASMDALLNSQEAEEDRIKMMVAWDNEEVGSDTFQGAASDFLPSTLERIAELCGMNGEQYNMMKANSGLISIDVAHGRHPNYFGKHEPNHPPLLGKGPVVKYHANQSYATNSGTDAWIYEAGIKAGVPIQKFCIRSDTRCGSTIGNIVAPKLGIRTVDIGAPIWAMHSTREKGHLLDHVYMSALLKQVLSMDLS